MGLQLKTIKGVGGVVIEFVEEVRKTSSGFERCRFSIWRLTADQLNTLRAEAGRPSET